MHKDLSVAVGGGKAQGPLITDSCPFPTRRVSVSHNAIAFKALSNVAVSALGESHSQIGSDELNVSHGAWHKTPRMLDLFCGRFGWGRAFAARGWEVVGVDMVEPPEIPQGCDFMQRDILTILGVMASEYDFICASSPCEQFSLHRMKMFHPNPPYPALGVKLFNHARALCEASGLPYIMENVKTAQEFVGRAVNHAGSFYLWGNAVPPLIPKGLTKGMKMNRAWCQALGGHGTKQRNSQTAGFATIPPELASCVADYAARLLESAA